MLHFITSRKQGNRWLTDTANHPLTVRAGRVLFLLDKGDDPEEDDGADDGGDDLSHEGAAPMDAEPSEDVTADEATDDTDEEVNPEAETGTFHQLAGKKSG